MTKKLLFITGSFPPIRCGIGDYTSILANSIADLDQKWEISVITDKNAEPKKGKVKIKNLVTNWGIQSLYILLKDIVKNRYAIIHIQYDTARYNGNYVIYFLPILLRLMGERVIQTWHEPVSRFRFIPCALALTNIIVIEPDYLKKIKKYYVFLIKNRIKTINLSSNIPVSNLDTSQLYDLRKKFGSSKRLISYFGFAIEKKGIEDIFEISQSQDDCIILICELSADNKYHRKLLHLIRDNKYNNIIVTGYLSSESVADILAASDAAIFPFHEGVGMRHTSVWAARNQGIFTITTSNEQEGYDKENNIYYARPHDIEMMRIALDRYAGVKLDHSHLSRKVLDKSWREIAEEHVKLYNSISNSVIEC